MCTAVINGHAPGLAFCYPECGAQPGSLEQLYVAALNEHLSLFGHFWTSVVESDQVMLSVRSAFCGQKVSPSSREPLPYLLVSTQTNGAGFPDPASSILAL